MKIFRVARPCIGRPQYPHPNGNNRLPNCGAKSSDAPTMNHEIMIHRNRILLLDCRVYSKCRRSRCESRTNLRFSHSFRSFVSIVIISYRASIYISLPLSLSSQSTPSINHHVCDAMLCGNMREADETTSTMLFSTRGQLGFKWIRGIQTQFSIPFDKTEETVWFGSYEFGIA